MRTIRPIVSLLLALACAQSAAAQKAPVKQEAKPPNILFIFTDDHGYQAISAYGSNRNQTPNIDRLAKEGMRFDRCFVTNSICGPSRAVILTGKHNHLNGFMTNGDRFDGSQQTFPKLLQKQGYETAMIGKWHLKTDPTGFDHWKVLIGQGPYYNPPMKSPEGTKKIEGYTTDIVTDLSLDWLKEGRDQSKPFLLMCQHKAPHRNWQPSPDHLKMFDGVEMPYPETFWDDYSGREEPASNQAMTVAHHLSKNDLKLTQPRGLTAEQLEKWNAAYGPKNAEFEQANLTEKERIKWQYQRYVKDYLRCVASVDDNIGRLLEYLDDSGQAKNTLVVYSSDQGWYLGEHGWYDKRWMYEESFRTPLIVRWPGVTSPGAVNDTHFVSNLDFAQTFLAAAGVKEIPDPMQGRSLVPLLQGALPKDWRTSFYYHYYEYPGAHAVRRHYGVRTERYKLINFYNLGKWELFDLEKDPNELKSLYGQPAYSGVTKNLKRELARLRERYQVPEDTRPVTRRKRAKRN
jgi:arylsulfatase A-like enzyme